MNCYCGSNRKYSECCEPFLNKTKKPLTAEELMRSRYSAYAVANVSYIKDTLAPESRADFDPKSTKEWAETSKWLGLKILSTAKGGANDKTGTVEFMAKYQNDGVVLEHHEVSQFRKDEQGQWLFVEGESHTHREGEDHGHHHTKQQTIVRDEPKIGRNDPCSCGSGKKFKKCCGA